MRQFVVWTRSTALRLRLAEMALRLDMTTPAFSWFFVDFRPSPRLEVLLALSRANVTVTQFPGKEDMPPSLTTSSSIATWLHDAVSLILRSSAVFQFDSENSDDRRRSELLATMKNTGDKRETKG